MLSTPRVCGQAIRALIELTMRYASQPGVDQDNIKPVDAAYFIERPARLSVGGIRKRLAHEWAAVVIARNCHEWHLERTKQLRRMRILFRQCRIGDVSGNHHQVRARRQSIQCADGPQKRRRGVDATVGQGPRPGNVQIGDLGD